jgi:3-methyl-2-oxobutanoate hydroxymethyltransferase
MKKQTLHSIQKLKDNSEPITVLTAYDSSFAKLVSELGVEIILVGDSLGMVIQGHQSTVPVSMQNMIYHTQCVATANQGSWLIADMPYMAYATESQTLANAAQLMQAGANMVKVEGGEWLCSSIQKLTERGIPVCAHLGLTPQSVDALGGFKVQGRDEANAKQIIQDALAIEKAGAKLLVLECVPNALASQITQQLKIPTIGIGAGNQTDGQVLVLQDMLGINNDFRPKFVKNFFEYENVSSINDAITTYIFAVKNRSFPDEEHSFV